MMSSVLALTVNVPALSEVVKALVVSTFTVTPSNGLPLLSTTVPVIFCVCAIAATEKKESNSINITCLNDIVCLFIRGLFD